MRRKICFLITYIVFLLFFSGCSPREEVFLLSKNENGFIVNLKDVSIDDFREERFNLDKKTLFNIDYSLTNGDVTLVVGDSNSEIIDIYKLSWIGNISFLLDSPSPPRVKWAQIWHRNTNVIYKLAIIT